MSDFKPMQQIIDEVNPSDELCQSYLIERYHCMASVEGAREALARFIPYPDTEEELKRRTTKP
jgi:chorismate mutase